MKGIPIDLEQLGHVSSGDAAFEAELLCEFCDLTADLMEELNRAVGENDESAIHAIAHTIKGSARTIGAVDLGDISERIEAATRMSDSSRVPEDAAHLASALRDLQAFVQKHCSTNAA